MILYLILIILIIPAMKMPWVSPALVCMPKYSLCVGVFPIDFHIIMKKGMAYQKEEKQV